MNTWQRIGQTPELCAVAYHDATRGTVRAVVLQYQPRQKTWWAYERTYKEKSIPLIEEHQRIKDAMTPQEQAICSILFVVDGGERSVLHMTSVTLSQALMLLDVPLTAACAADQASPLW